MKTDGAIIVLTNEEVTLLRDALDLYISESPYVDGEILSKLLYDEFCSLADQLGISDD